MIQIFTRKALRQKQSRFDTNFNVKIDGGVHLKNLKMRKGKIEREWIIMFID